MFLYTSNELSEKELGKLPFTIASKTMKYLGVNLTFKNLKDLYAKLYNILIKKTEGDTSKWNYVHAHGLEELTLLKCTYYSRQSADSVQFLPKFEWHFS